MQESFSQRFDKAIERVKEELIDYVESTEIVSTLENHSKEVNEVLEENQELRNRCRVLEGRLSRAETEIRDLKEESLMQ